METPPGGRIGPQGVLGNVSQLPGQTAAARRRRVYASGDGANGYSADLRGASDFERQSIGNTTPRAYGSARVSGVELV